MGAFKSSALAVFALLKTVTAVTNPTDFVLSSGFADPRSIYYEGTYYAFATNNYKNHTTGPLRNVPTAMSKNFSSGWSFTLQNDILPDPGNWTAPTPQVWDPAVQSYNSSHFVMYYAAATSADPSKHCIGAAAATSILGTYTPQSTPLLCDSTDNIYISPNPFVYNNHTYIVYKNGNGLKARILLHQLSADGLSLVGPATQLIHSDSSLSDTEGPTMVFNPANNGHPILLFVAGIYTKSNYRIMYAAAPTSSLIPPNNESYAIIQTPLLQTGMINGVQVTGPGGPDFPSLQQFPNQMTFMADQNTQDFTIAGRSMRTAILTYNADNTLSILPSS